MHLLTLLLTALAMAFFLVFTGKKVHADTVQDLYEKRANIVAQARKLMDDHKDDWTDERQAQYDKMDADIDKLTKEIRNREKLEAIDREAAESTGRQLPPPTPEVRTGEPVRPTSTPEYRAAYMEYVRTGNPNELRSLNITADPSGGYLIPDELHGSMVTALNEYVPMRQYATVITTSSDRNIPVANLDGTAYWTDEEDSYTESDETLALRVLTGHKLTRLQKVSEELVQDSQFDIGGFLSNAFAMSFSKAEEPAFTDGNGIARPLGYIVDADLGVTTAAADAIEGDEIIDLFYSLKAPYRRRAVWQMNDATCGVVRKMKDGLGQYLWQPSLQAGQPDAILGRPVVANNSVDTIAASTDVIAFGDFSFYYIVDRGQPILQRLVELYAATGQVGYRMARRMDGKLTISEAVKRMRMHA